MEWDDVYRSVGEVAVNAVTLEDALVRLACVVDENLDPTALLASSVKTRRAARRAVEQIAELAPELHAEAARFVADAEALLDERHAKVHSLTVIYIVEGLPAFTQWHAKSDAEVDFDPEEFRDLTLRIGGCTTRGWQIANQYRQRAAD